MLEVLGKIFLVKIQSEVQEPVGFDIGAHRSLKNLCVQKKELFIGILLCFMVKSTAQFNETVVKFTVILNFLILHLHLI